MGWKCLYCLYGMLDGCFQTEIGETSEVQKETAFHLVLRMENSTEICGAARAGDGDVD